MAKTGDSTDRRWGRPDVAVRDEHYVYILRCDDDTLYTGYTTDLDRRVEEHNRGDGAAYTRGRTPVTLVHVESYDSKSTAMSREWEIKQLSREQKQSLVSE
jgi:putative endonuclease